MISDVVIAILIGCGLFVGFAWAIVSFADERKHPTPQPPVQTERDRIRARLLAEMEAEHEALSARPERVARAEALIDRVLPDPSVPKGER